MKNFDKVTISRASMVEWRRKEDCDVCAYYTGGPCDKNGMECREGMIKWLNQKPNPMPEIKAGDMLFISEMQYYVAVAPDKLTKLNCFVLVDLENALKFDTILKIMRWDPENNEVLEIWRAEE